MNRKSEQFLSIPTDRGMISPSYSGVAFLLSWIYLLFYANSAGIEAAPPVSLMGVPYTLSSFAMCAAVLIVAFGPKSLPEKIMSNKMKAASSTGTSIGTFFLLCAGEIDAIWMMLLGAIITGLFSGILAQQWVVAYRRIGLKTMISSFPALLAVSSGICMTIMYLPAVFITITTIIMPIISGFLLHSVRKSLFPLFDIGTQVKDRPLDFAIILFPIGIFAITSGFLDFYSYQSTYTYFFYMAVSAILLITACVFVLIANRKNMFACIVIPLCFFACVFVPFFTMLDYVPASNFISIGELGIEIALFSVALGFADFFSINALKTYALCRVVYATICMLGWYLGSFSNSALSDMINSQASLALVFVGVEVISVCLIVAIVKAQKTLPPQSSTEGHTPQNHEPHGPSVSQSAQAASITTAGEATSSPILETTTFANMDDTKASSQKDLPENPFSKEGASIMQPSSSPEPDSAKAPRSMESVCLEIGREYGLSNREMDVFALLARGYSASAIQSELYIAPGTVNYHTRNIYSKLNVHSKQELISLVSKAV